MKLQFESSNINDYLKENLPIIQFSSPFIQHIIQDIKIQTNDKFEQSKIAFEIARDQINHSFDTNNQLITITAEEALQHHEGICFAKAHTFATLARGLGIPVGFCYQRVLKKPLDVHSGFALHGLNAVFLEKYGWFRVDPRGNKPGIDAQFTPKKEQLAYTIHEDLGEIDYPHVFTKPLDTVITAMKTAKTTQDLFNNRPTTI